MDVSESLFHKIPSVVQFKILREYVPSLYKFDVLRDMPEFSDLLRWNHAWSNASSESFFEFLEAAVRRLRTGVYVLRENTKRFGVVLKNEETISFRFYSLLSEEEEEENDDGDGDRRHSTKNEKIVDVQSSFSEAARYIIQFVNEWMFLDEEWTINTGVYSVAHEYDTFYICFLSNTVFWEDGKTYPLENNECIIPDPNFEYRFLLYYWITVNRKNRAVDVTRVYMNTVTDTVQASFPTAVSVFPVSLESLWTSDAKVTSLTFKIDGKNVKTSANVLFHREGLAENCRRVRSSLYNLYEKIRGELLK